MNPDIKAKWIPALRSGDYPQTQFGLRDSTGFCCFGVLCDIVDPNGWEVSSKTGTKRYSHNLESAYPSREVFHKAGLPSGYAKLANMNDSGSSFSDIADYIEEYL